MTVMMQGKLSEIVRFMIFHFQLFQLVYASPDTSCVFIFSFDRREGKPCSIFVQVYNLQERALLSCLINKNESFS